MGGSANITRRGHIKGAVLRQTPMQTFLDAMPMTRQKMIQPDGIGHRNPIAQLGTVCQMEFQLIHLRWVARFMSSVQRGYQTARQI